LISGRLNDTIRLYFRRTKQDKKSREETEKIALEMEGATKVQNNLRIPELTFYKGDLRSEQST